MEGLNGIVLIGVFVAVEGAHAFSAFMPSYFTVSKFAKGEVDRQRLREGYGPAVAFNLALGGVVSAIVKDARPALFSIIVCLMMIALYERAIARTED